MAALMPDHLPGDRLRHRATDTTGTLVRVDARGRLVWTPDGAATPDTAHPDELDPQ